MMRRIALVGNPNSGKTTLFNALTGSNQKVGNWPGVTVTKTEGRLRKASDTVVVDLPGIYSLSPYTTEEVVARDFLLDERPELILNVVDGTNLERSLYLTSQLLELELPMVIAFNMADLVAKSKTVVDFKQMQALFKVPVIAISANKRKGLDALIGRLQTAKAIGQPISFSPVVEEQLNKIQEELKKRTLPRFWAIKYFERDQKMIRKDCLEGECPIIESIIAQSEAWLDSDGESIIASERYDWIETAMDQIYCQRSAGKTLTDRIDEIVTHRWLGIPIFLMVMYGVYYLSITTLGTLGTDWVNEVLFGEIVPETVTHFLEGLAIHPLLISLVVEGIITGVGAVLGFIPQMAMLFLCLAVLEDCGYMARIAFVMDRVFKKFGLSGKSFIPLLVGSGCSVPGIQASRTIENEQNRQLTILTTSFIPCSAKLPVIALIANAIFDGSQWVAFSMYLAGIVSVLISSILLKKVLFGQSEAIPFVMELPAYHMPELTSLIKTVWKKVRSFVARAGSVIFISSCLIWFLASFSYQLAPVEEAGHSLLAMLGGIFAPLFAPLGFGDWQSVTATIQGLIAKENVVSTLGVIQGLGGEVDESSTSLLVGMSQQFTQASAISFLVFNMLCMPCFAAVGAMRTEFNDDRMALMAVLYQMFYAYGIAFIVYHLMGFFDGSLPLTVATVGAFLLLGSFLVLLLAPANLVYQWTHWSMLLPRKEAV